MSFKLALLSESFGLQRIDCLISGVLMALTKAVRSTAELSKCVQAGHTVSGLDTALIRQVLRIQFLVPVSVSLFKPSDGAWDAFSRVVCVVLSSAAPPPPPLLMPTAF